MMITVLLIYWNSFPTFFFHEYATWRYLKRGVKYEEISTFWHGHRNRCLIFLCEVRWKQKGTFSKFLLLLFEYIWLQSTKLQNWKKKQRKKCWSKFRKKRRLLAEWRDNAWIIALFVFLSKFLPFFCFSFNRWILCFW